ncbi:MAG TPA: AAA family ATPase, partial [Chloroflexota bacterium]
DLMDQLGLPDGQVIRITTQHGRCALGRVAASKSPASSGSIRIDRFTRQTLKVFPHEQVNLELVDLAPAPEVVLVPGIDMSMLRAPNLVPQLKALLSGDAVPVREGMLLYLQPPDRSTGIVYEVHHVAGTEGVVTDVTELYLEVEHDHQHDEGGHHAHEHGARAEAVLETTFEDVGGLGDQIRVIREYVELPLIFPHLYQQVGITAPRGVIFYGAPGTGKTLLARSVANEINAQFFYINGPEVVGTYSGQTEENLRRIFGEASFNPPSIIFIDELDAVAPARRTASTLSDARAVTQLLSLMDGLKRAEGVIVIGTTNRIEAIDPALRRAGRFDREVYFPTPSVAARNEILRVQTRDMPLTDDALAALPNIAEQAYGYVGADLMELAREAGLNALRRASSKYLGSPSLPTALDPSDLVVTQQDFETALNAVHPASLRESLLSYPRVTWADIGGLAPMKTRLMELVQEPLRHPDAFARIGLSTNLGVLLHGPPGTGKTLLVHALARETGINFIAIQGPELFSQWLGESEESVRHVFDLARRAAPCLVFFDQLDAVLPRRGLADEGTRAPQRVVSQVFSELDRVDQASQIFVVGATNDLALVDPAALRPGRFGVHLAVGNPDTNDRAEILNVHLRGAAFPPDVDGALLAQALAARTDGLSGADLGYIVQSAKLRALSESQFADSPALTIGHFAAALAEFKPKQEA